MKAARIGILGLLHESNTFVTRRTTLAAFEENVLLADAEAIRTHFDGAHHELGGFLAELDQAEAKGEVECVPLFVARALPAGVIDAASWSQLTTRLLEQLQAAGSLDGILVAPHGATVSEDYPDADGHWLALVREHIGADVVMGGTLDLHANLSPTMVEACDFLTAYRSNPHLDQHARGREAARIMIDAVMGRCRPVMAAAFPPLAISIDRQDTDQPWLAEVYALAQQQRDAGLLSTSLLLGFPYADVAEMGAATVAVADGDAAQAQAAANQLASALIGRREHFRGQLEDIETSLDELQENSQGQPACVLDMGDNVGGGSAADGTVALHALLQRDFNAFVCLYDPESVKQAWEAAAGGAIVAMTLGGKVDSQHGEPVSAMCSVVSLHDGVFHETQPRHGGMAHFDQGATAVVQTATSTGAMITIMLTSKRMTPFSLEQLRSCEIDPSSFDILVAKGVHAPLAAYREVCSQIVRVNTPGSTCADMHALSYDHRRQPLFPLEDPFAE